MYEDVKRLVAAMMLVVGLAVAASAARAEAPKDTVSLAGDIVCAKCTLKVAGLDHCQNVLLVGDGAQQKQLWLVANEVSAAFGEVCTARRPVSVTGTVESRDGKQWLTPTRIEPRSGS